MNFDEYKKGDLVYWFDVVDDVLVNDSGTGIVINRDYFFDPICEYGTLNVYRFKYQDYRLFYDYELKKVNSS